MRKLLMIALLLIPSLVYAQWFGAEYSLDLGIADAASVGYTALDEPVMVKTTDGRFYTMNNEIEMHFARLVYTEMNVRFWAFKHLFAGGGTTVLVKPIEPYWVGYYDPFFLRYTFEVGAVWGPATLRYTHQCAHPQVTYAYRYALDQVWGEGSVNRVSLEFDFTSGEVPD